MTQQQSCPLSNDLKLACEIWHFNAIKEPVWLGKLETTLSPHMTKQEISNSLDTLFDWGIIYGEYGPTEKGRAGRLYFVDTYDGGNFRIRDLYEKHWKDARGKL